MCLTKVVNAKEIGVPTGNDSSCVHGCPKNTFTTGFGKESWKANISTAAPLQV